MSHFDSAIVAEEHRHHLMTKAERQRLARAARAWGRGAEDVHLRVLEPEDADHIASLFERLSPRSRYLRFFSPVAKVPEATLRRLASIDHLEHEAVGAFEGAALIGAAHSFRSPTDRSVADIAIEVVDSHQRDGIGAWLLHELAACGRQNGITHFVASTLAENTAALALLRESPWPSVIHTDGPEVTIDLRLTGAVASAGDPADKAIAG